MPTRAADTDAPARLYERVADATAGTGSAIAFGVLSALRRKRAFHPTGVAFDAAVDLNGAGDVPLGVPLLDEPARRPAVIRLSRGAGLPEPLPDVLGLAVRLVDAHGGGQHQDLLLVTSGRRPVLRHALVPAASWNGATFSSLLPYRVGGQDALFGARTLLAGDGTAPRLRRLEDARAAAEAGRLRFALEVTTPAGEWREIGTVDVGRHLPGDQSDTLRFNPFNTGGGIEPAGTLQALRRKAYQGSQAARPR